MLTKYIPFVNDQAVFHEHMAKRFGHDKVRSAKHAETSAMFRQLVADIQAMQSKTVAVPVSEETESSKRKIQLDLSYEEVDGLPPELIQELSVSEGDRTEFAIIKIIRELGGAASLDRLLVGLYKETGEIMKRTTLTSRIYRMSQKGMVFSVPNRKGVYSLRELSPEETLDLFN